MQRSARSGDGPRSPRQGHLEARLRRALQTILARGLHDPRFRGLVSVTEVDLSPDQARASVGISVLPSEHGPLTVAALRHAAPHLAAEVGQMVRSRRLPQLDFQLDDRLKKQAALDAALNSTKGEDAS
ncbi:MAG: 30S ribosome-binding factor RbfA [Phycisphaeraceae bacterium]|nr:30S ribosome-binding factor RbfA [Phycisphaeraceae bacterium]